MLSLPKPPADHLASRGGPQFEKHCSKQEETKLHHFTVAILIYSGAVVWLRMKKAYVM
jgi:hypothetical protein